MNHALRSVSRHAFGYAGVSGLCLVMHNLWMIATDSLGMMLPLAVLSSFLLVNTAAYVLHSLISFRKEMGVAAWLRYLLAMSANIPLAWAAIWMWAEAVGLPMYWASPIASVCMIAINYMLARWTIGRHPQAPGR
ncbi:MAG: GtrA family protein [Reyranellaceae bacterium]